MGALQVVIGIFTPLALTSIGGVGIYSAPVLLPLLWIAGDACRGRGRWYFTILAALLAAETAWAISWFFTPDLQAPLPLLVLALTVAFFAKTLHRDLPSRTVAVVLVGLGLFGLAGIGALATGAQTTTREVQIERSPSLNH